MEKEEIRNKVIQVMEAFGMTAEVVAKAMSVSVDTVRKKKSEKSADHSFNVKNYNDLVDYIKKEASKIKKYSKT